MASGGIGDHVLGLTVAEGLRRDHPASDVLYVCNAWAADWVRLFWPADLVTTEPQDDLPTFRPHETYPTQNAERLRQPRWEYYAAACGTRARLPAPRPLPRDAVAWAERFAGAVVLSPWSFGGNRQWLLSHWLRLERLLLKQGCRCLVLDGMSSDRKRSAAFESEVLCDEPAARVAAVMALSGCVVGNDSAMAHVAGMLRVPAVALCAQVRGERVFGIYDAVKVLQGPLPCSGCHWSGPDWRPACGILCASLQALSPEVVADTVLAHAAAPAGLLRDPAVDRALVAMLKRLQVAGTRFDRRATFTRFLQGVRRQPRPVLVETGCVRAEDNWCDGVSTCLLGLFLSSHGGVLHSVDLDAHNVAFARREVAGLGPAVQVHHADSRDWLRAYAAGPIDGLYLDSQDTHVPGFAEVCLQEAEAALPKLADDALVLIDDTWCDGGGERGLWQGKGALAVPWLLSRGFRLLEAGYQTLLGKGSAAY